MGIARKVFDDTKPSIRLLFGPSADIRVEDGHYVVGELRLPEEMVEKIFAPGGLLLKADCSIVPLTVFNERDEECVMIVRGRLSLPPTANVMIPGKFLYKLTNPHETYPQKWQ